MEVKEDGGEIRLGKGAVGNAGHTKYVTMETSWKTGGKGVFPCIDHETEKAGGTKSFPEQSPRGDAI